MEASEASEQVSPEEPWTLERRFEAGLDIVEDWLRRFLEIQGLDRAVALGAQAFTALLPLLIVYSALAQGDGGDFSTRIVRRLHLHGGAAQAVHDAFASGNSIQHQATVLGIFLLVFSSLSFTRSFQRMYELAYRLPPMGVRGTVFGLQYLAVVVVMLTIRPVLLNHVGPVLHFLITVVLYCATGVIGPYLLLSRRLPWRRLIPNGVLNSIGLTGLALASLVYLPRSVTSLAEEFGAIGIGFALVSWLVAMASVLVVAAAGAAAIDHWLQGEEPVGPPPRILHGW
jgi:membrane protein